MEYKKVKCPICGWWLVSEASTQKTDFVLKNGMVWETIPDYICKCNRCHNEIGIIKRV